MPTLSEITDILDPDTAQRAAFQEPIGVVTISSSVAFDLAAHAGRVLSFNASAGAVALTLPATSDLSARADGWLCSASVQSSANNTSIVAPTDALRIQNDQFGLAETQTTAFIGLSRASSFRAWVDIYKVGGVYAVRGQARPGNAADLDFSHGAPGSISGAAIATSTLPGTALAATVNGEGTRTGGGFKRTIRTAAGATALAQTDSGNIVQHTGGSPATWTVPALDAGTSIDLENSGAGTVTLSIDGGQTAVGGLVLPSNGTANVLWRSGGSVRLVGTI